jgi:hypothetical protein
MHTGKEGMTRFTRREFCFDVTRVLVGGGFAPINLKITPTNAIMFPWLSSIVNAWQKYAFLGLAFEYIPQMGELATSPALGTWNMAVQYDSSLTIPPSKPALLGYEGAISVAPNGAAIMGVECADDCTVIPLKFTNTNSAQTPAALNLGMWMGVAVGQPATVPDVAYVIGSIFVTYDIVLLEPSTHNTFAFLGSSPEEVELRKLQDDFNRLFCHRPARPHTIEEIFDLEEQTEAAFSRLRSPHSLRLRMRIESRQAQLDDPCTPESADTVVVPGPLIRSLRR